MRRQTIVFLFALLMVVSGTIKAQARDWKATAEKAGLSSQQIRQLANDKILISEQRRLQVFAPYIDPTIPVFITSDSILHAYHILFEETISRVEQRNCERLPEILRLVWENLETVDEGVQGERELASAAKDRARIVIGTALRLLGDEKIEPDAKVAAIIEDEVRWVTAAEGTRKPAWLGPPDELDLLAIDYSRYKPRGFYANFGPLARYFQAVSWLQSIPFRVSKDEELLAILMLGNCIGAERFGADEAKRNEYESFFECFRQLLGEKDDWDLITAATVVPGTLTPDPDGNDLAEIRRSLIRKAGGNAQQAQINDQIAYLPSGPSFRVISAHRTPDAILFQQTTDPTRFRRSLPSGLEVAIALGSSYAETRLEGPDKEEILATIEQSQDLFSGSSLYFDYLHCLSAVLDPPPRNAPAFMSREPWQIKSCQAALAGWAQLRHTWALQAKQTVVWYCLGPEAESYVGFVEPDPEFFRRMARLAQDTLGALPRGDLSGDRRLATITELQRLLRFLEKKAASNEELDSREEPLSIDEFYAYEALRCIEAVHNVKAVHPEKIIPIVEHVLDQLEKRDISADQYSSWFGSPNQFKIRPRWQDLASLCSRLEALADKQLQGVRFTAEDERLVLLYGEKLAEILFHTGDESETPRDDVPRVVDVVYNPTAEKYLEVGIGRPRICYVLYPVKSGEVFCRGAVLPYFEFEHPKRLNDTEWKGLLDSEQRPAQPAWMTPLGISGSDGLGSVSRTGCIVAILVILLGAGLLAVVIRRKRNMRAAGIARAEGK